MEKSKAKDSILGSRPDAEKIVAENYGQLLEWAKLLTRGDLSKAQDIVQDLYLHFALAKPDLSNIKKLDGYLYISLKHLYLSMLARSSREAMRVVSLEDFDSVEFAIEAHRDGDLLQRQNDLRRLCFYSVWRKEQSKGFCYFILHFFHGYYRHEISDLARVPMAAIYNKLKSARSEVKSYLQNSGKIHIADTDPAPEPVLVWSPVSAPELFRELRGYILSACLSECLPEAELLSYYKKEATSPIPRELLAHIVSCERCLSIIDGHSGRPSLKEREPLDAIGYFGEGRNIESRKEKENAPAITLRILQHRRQQFFEHRPRILSIAVNGAVVAFQEIFSERSVLTARTEQAEETNFVEVFTEQGIRLAFLPVLELPPIGPHEQSETVALSDGRWLRLSLTFDGQGLSSEVTYFDPILGLLPDLEEEEERVFQGQPAVPLLPSLEKNSLRERLRSLIQGFSDRLDHFAPARALAWSLLLVVGLSTAAYLTYRQMEQPTSAVQALNHSVQITASELQGQTEHQILHFEERSSEGKLLHQGNIDLWKDGDGTRSLRRLYNTDQQLVAAEWQLRDGKKKSYLKAESKQDQALVEDNLWQVDVSPRAFVPAQHQSMQMRKTPHGYEISINGALSGSPQVVSATLVLDRQWHFVRQVMRIRRRTETYEVRYEQVSDERRPAHSVSDSFFVPEEVGPTSELNNQRLKPGLFSPGGQGVLKGLSTPDLAQLELAALYEMSQLGSDASDPIEMVRTSEGRLRIFGAVAKDSRKQELLSRLAALPNHEYLEVRISSPKDGAAALSRWRRSSRQQLEVYDVGQKTPLADRLLRRILASKRLSGDALNTAVINFSQEALDHAQFALQEANALHRLGQTWSPAELRSMSVRSQQLWAEMVVKHATSLESQMDDLSVQLDELAYKRATIPARQAPIQQIETLEDFSLLTQSLLQQTQSIHREIGKTFASNASVNGLDDPEALIAQIRASMPRQQIEALLRFARRMKQ